jgi:hypothetical protein
MKYLKMLGLAAMAGMAVMAVAGAGTASATELCTVNTPENEPVCPAATKYGIGTTVEASSTNSTLTSSLGNVVCSSSSIKGKTTTAGGAKLSVEGKIEALTWGGCTLTTPLGGTHNCTVTAINLPYKAVVTKTTQPNGTLTVSSGGSGEPGAKVDCGAQVLRCQFTSPSIVLDVTAGETPTVVAKEETLNRTVYEGGICPEKATWDATYTVTVPHALYLVN